MGEACERRFDNCCLGYGPPLEEGGFFYDFHMGEGKTLNQEDWKGIEDVAKLAVKEKQAFERLELPKEKLLEMFKVSYLPHCPRALADVDSTTNTSNTISMIKSRMERCQRYIDVDHLSIYVWDLTFPILVESSQWQLQR